MNTSREQEFRLRALLAGLAWAILMFLSFAPFEFWGCALLAPLPLVMAMQSRTKKPCIQGLAVAVGTLPFWLYEQTWIADVSGLGYIPIVLFGAMWTWLLVWVGGSQGTNASGLGRIVWIAAVWTGLDYFRGAVLGGGYPWYFVSQPLIDAPGVPEIASIIGQFGVTTMLVIVAVAAIMLVDEKQRKVAVRTLVGVFLTMGAMIWLGVLTRPSASGQPIRIAIVQTNIQSDNKVAWTMSGKLADFARFAELTREAARLEPDLIVWPETMLPGGPADPASNYVARQREISWLYTDEQGQEQEVAQSYFADEIERLQRETGVPMLIGAEAADGLDYVGSQQSLTIEYDGVYNSALVVTNGRIQDRRYDKVHLTPFGETMPFLSLWPWLQNKLLALGANGMMFDLSEGRRATVLELDLGDDTTLRAGTPICFESTVPWVCRAMVKSRDGAGAEMLFNLTNDGWFSDSDIARSQHLLLARWRSAELARPMVRAANTGISAFIDIRGQVLARGIEGDSRGARVEGILQCEVAPVRGLTIYARVGDVAGVVSLIGAAIMCVASVIRKKKRGATRSRT